MAPSFGPTSCLVFMSTLFFSLLASSSASASSSSTIFRTHKLPFQAYIVHLHPYDKSDFPSRLDWHRSFLERALSSEEEDNHPSSRLLYSYRSSMEGFAALLSDSEAESLRTIHGVIAVRPDRRLDIHTTYSYKFLGLDAPGGAGAWSKTSFGRGTVIGVLDTGVWPESPSFNDHGMPPPPKSWKGACEEGQEFNSSICNNKLIGARFFIKGHRAANLITPTLPHEYVSARDSSGHGTHTSSTAGGSPVAGASVLGVGAGVAKGMAPGAHIAVYKVCWFNGGCYSSDILAAIDVAIRDGVNVLSLSLGGFPVPFYDDPVAIGSFHAVQKGISVVCAAGNNGPLQSTVANDAPWITTVGASTLNRRFPAFVRMGSGKYLYGESMFPGAHSSQAEKELEVVYLTGGESGSEFCLDRSLPRELVKGKMVVCDRGVNGRAEKGEVVKKAGGAAMILANTEINLDEDSVDVHVLPATLIGYSDSVKLKGYINSTKNPTAKILFVGSSIGRSRAPAVARFSSRGPSMINPDILKPDVIAPGVNIIAAWPQNLGPSGLVEDSRRVNFTVLSGTSMSCPHVSGIAALIRSAHPSWSPAAVKSAMMTTADVTDDYRKPISDGGNPAEFFAMGAGQINPDKAVDPGLVYDIKPEDYITHLCSLGYTKPEISIITRRNISCSDQLKRNKGFSLNYPAISATFKGKERVKVISRRVTNVGRPNSIYSVEVKAPEGVRVVVKPKQLVFRKVDQMLSYKVYVIANKGKGRKPGQSGQGELVWVHSQRDLYRVRSPITVSWKNKMQ